MKTLGRIFLQCIIFSLIRTLMRMKLIFLAKQYGCSTASFKITTKNEKVLEAQILTGLYRDYIYIYIIYIYIYIYNIYIYMFYCCCKLTYLKSIKWSCAYVPRALSRMFSVRPPFLFLFFKKTLVAFQFNQSRKIYIYSIYIYTKYFLLFVIKTCLWLFR